MPDFKPWQWATLIALLVALNIVIIGGLIVVIATYDLWTSPGHLAAEPTVPPWATPTATKRPTFTPTITPETWPTATVTRTPTRTPTPTSTWTPLPTRTPWWTDTPISYQAAETPTPTSTWTPLPTFTHTPMPPTHTPTPTSTPTPRPPVTKTATATHTPLPTLTPPPTASSTPRRQPSPTPANSAPPTSTSSPSATHTPSATPTASPTPTHTPTASPSPTHTPSPSPSPTVTAAASLSPAADPAPPPISGVTNTSSPATDIYPLEAVPLANHGISLAWEPVAEAIAYRVYSDMGTGYGVYVYKAETQEQALIDTKLRAGLRYQYRVGSITPQGEQVLAWANATTAYRSESQAGGRSDAPGREAMAANAGQSQALAAPKPMYSSVRITPAPTPLPPDTVILGLLSASNYADELDNTLTIVGEVRNDSHLDVGETIVTATFYGTDGQVIGEASGSTMLHSLAPGMRSPFIITLPRPAGLADYSMRATGRPINLTASEAGLKVVNTRRFEDKTGFYHVAGVIENASGRRVQGARVIVTLYDRGGNVVNVGFAYPQPASLSPSDRADFDITFTYYPKVFSHLAVAIDD